MLALVPQDALDHAAVEREFLAQYDAVMERFAQALAPERGWFIERHGRPSAPRAYLSAEYGLHYSLPLYAGGLGMLAGDHLKACSDLAAPVVGVGIDYLHGYFKQRIREDGWQENVMERHDRTYEPITRVLDASGKPLRGIPRLRFSNAFAWRWNAARVSKLLRRGCARARSSPRTRRCPPGLTYSSIR